MDDQITDLYRLTEAILVNMRFMKMVRTNEVELDNGEILSVSRDKVQDVREKQMIYLRSFAYADN